MDSSTITLAELAPYVDHTTALGVEIAVQKLRAARLEQELADANRRITELEDEVT